jgi:hypothetical protein
MEGDRCHIIDLGLAYRLPWKDAADPCPEPPPPPRGKIGYMVRVTGGGVIGLGNRGSQWSSLLSDWLELLPMNRGIDGYTADLDAGGWRQPATPVKL